MFDLSIDIMLILITQREYIQILCSILLKLINLFMRIMPPIEKALKIKDTDERKKIDEGQI